MFECLATFRDGAHDRSLGCFILRSVNDLDRAWDIVAADRVERLVLKTNKIVGVPFRAGEKFIFVWREAEFAQALHGDIAVPVDVQFALKCAIMTRIAGGGISPDRRGQLVAAPGE